ncbi:hypothetical protein AB1E18_004853 [Capra hircus]
MTRLPPSAPPGPEAALMPSPGPGEVLQQRCSSARSPGVRRAALSAGSNPAMETSGQCPQNSTSAEPPRLVHTPSSFQLKSRSYSGVHERGSQVRHR